MNIEVWKIIGNSIGIIGGAAIMGITIWKGVKELLAADVQKTEAKHRAAVEIEREKTKGLKDFNDLRKDIADLEEDIQGMKEEIFDEKKQLLERLDKLRNHFEEMTKDYFRILSKQ